MNEDTRSYWHKTAAIRQYPRLEKDMETDVLIVGGGITGITCADCLARKGAKPLLVEAGGLCDGTTGNSTGKVTLQHGLIYGKIEAEHGREAARLYAQSQADALRFVRQRVEEDKIDCQYAETAAYIFASDESDRKKLQREEELAAAFGIEASYTEESDFPPGSFGTLRFARQAVLHPVRYVGGLAAGAAAQGARIFGGTKVIRVEEGEPIRAVCENGAVIRAGRLVMATQYPIFDGPNLFFTRLYAKRAYGIAWAAEGNWPDGGYISSGQPTRSIRTHVENGRRVLIVVGDDHPTARGEENEKLHLEHLADYARSIAGAGTLLAGWSAQDYDTPDGIPYIGRISDRSPVYAAAGFQKWGLSSGTLAGMMLADLIADGNSRYESLYSRKRSDYAAAPGRAAKEVLGSVAELVRSKLEKAGGLRDLQRGEGRVIRFGRQKAGIYRDDGDAVTILDISCTHMGTELRFNAAEKSWDCPAHGGRFAAGDGRLLEGPPKDPLRVLYRGRWDDLVTVKRK